MVATARARRQQRKELYGIIALALGVFLTLCFISYDPADPALNVASNMDGITNLGGPVGAYTADLLFTIFGVSAYVLAGICFLLSGILFMGRQVHATWHQLLAFFAMIFATATLFHLRFSVVMIRDQPIEAGGLVGGLLGAISVDYLNIAGAYVLAGTLLCLSFFYATNLSLGLIIRWTASLVTYCASWLWQWGVIYAGRCSRILPKAYASLREWIANWRAKRMEENARNERLQEKELVAAQQEIASIRKKASDNPDDEEIDDIDDDDLEEYVDDEYEDEDELDEDEDEYEDDEDEDDDSEDEDEDEDDEYEDEDELDEDEDDENVRIFTRKDAVEKKRKPSQLELTRISGQYVFPSLSLLDAAEQVSVPVDEASLRRGARLLIQKLEEYGIHGRVSEIHPGPVVTMFEFEPAAGVKVNKIVNAEDDLSVTMGGRTTRIVPHLPGKAAVGIEIPNMERETVWLKDIIGDQKFRRAGAHLPLAMGKDIEGHTVVADLTKMPHLLVAGATGAGKSVAINAMICSILYKATPADVRLILVDPKMLELSGYNGIPHLLLPVVTKPKDATLALKWAVREMSRRYHLLSNARVRNIIGYNEKIEKNELDLVSEEQAEEMYSKDPEAIAHTGKMPYIVIIIDEMADLMMVSARDIEENVTRLAQMARACGIHLILATQRPSVDVITGLIKANFPSRVAFKVSSKHDARTIIDTVGAEKLLGAGDMLFMAPGAVNLTRIHGAYVTENEISRIVAHVKSQADAQYDETILQAPETDALGLAVEEEYDELYDKAVQLVTTEGQASISMVQRKLRIGYNRAARMIERMEVDGIVGPPEGSKPRQILVEAH